MKERGRVRERARGREGGWAREKVGGDREERERERERERTGCGLSSLTCSESDWTLGSGGG